VSAMAVRRLTLALCCCTIVALVAVDPAWAARIRCPVCGQILPESTEVCPNDGTDLGIAGSPVEEAPEAATAAGEEDAQGEDVGGYKRHDLDEGGRQRSDEAGGGYSDRHRRIGDERRGPEQAEKRRKERERRRREFGEEDEAIRSRFEEGRQEMWRRRHRSAQEERERREAEGFEMLRRRTLWGQAAPLASIGMRLSWMGEGTDSGPVAGAEMEFNPLKGRFRLGGALFLGARNLTDREDALFLGTLSVGLQRPWRYSPYLIARGGIGALMSNRSGEDLTYLAASVGVEGGIDSRVTRSLVITPSLGYVRHYVRDAHWDSFTVKLSVGF